MLINNITIFVSVTKMYEIVYEKILLAISVICQIVEIFLPLIPCSGITESDARI